MLWICPDGPISKLEIESFADVMINRSYLFDALTQGDARFWHDHEFLHKIELADRVLARLNEEKGDGKIRREWRILFISWKTCSVYSVGNWNTLLGGYGPKRNHMKQRPNHHFTFE